MSKVDRSNPVYSIGIVQKLTGLSGRQIRYYEEQKLISPHRTKGNQRMYSPSDVDLLLKVKSLLEQGYNIEGVRNVIQTERLAPEEPAPAQSPETKTEPIDHDLIVRHLRDTRKLTSLYPVNNIGELQRLLREMSRDE